MMMVVNVVHRINFWKHMHHGNVEQSANRDQHNIAIPVVELLELHLVLQRILLLGIEAQKTNECCQW
jgi:hypothetical protein